MVAATNGGSLAGKAALITGAASGIGRATALRFASEGASVACADLDGDGAEDTAARIAESGGASLAIQLDVTAEQEVQDALARCTSEFGALDVLYNNAGVGGGGSWEETLSVNLSGVYYGLLHGARLMAERGGGSIINTASILGLVASVPRPHRPEPDAEGPPAAGAYVAAKHGVVGLTRSFAVRYGPLGVRVNAICPGYIETPMTAAIRETPEDIAHLVALHPIGRLGLSGGDRLRRRLPRERRVLVPHGGGAAGGRRLHRALSGLAPRRCRAPGAPVAQCRGAPDRAVA